MRSILLTILKIVPITLSIFFTIQASEIPLSDMRLHREFPSSKIKYFQQHPQGRDVSIDKTTLERDIDWYYRVPIQKWEKAQQKAKDEEEKQLLAQEQEIERERIKRREEAEKLSIKQVSTINNDAESDDALMEDLKTTLVDLEKVTQKWEREKLVEDIKDTAMSATKIISREGLPLVTGGSIAASLGYGGMWVIGSVTALSAIPVAVPFAVAAVGGGATYLGLRLGAPGFLEKLPDKIINLFKEKESVPDDWVILSVNS